MGRKEIMSEIITQPQVPQCSTAEVPTQESECCSVRMQSTADTRRHCDYGSGAATVKYACEATQTVQLFTHTLHSKAEICSDHVTLTGCCCNNGGRYRHKEAQMPERGPHAAAPMHPFHPEKWILFLSISVEFTLYIKTRHISQT